MPTKNHCRQNYKNYRFNYKGENMKKNIKYYVEICHKDYLSEYIMQSDWFDTKAKALEYANTITYLEDIYLLRIMGAEWNEETYEDIFLEEYIRR